MHIGLCLLERLFFEWEDALKRGCDAAKAWAEGSKCQEQQGLGPWSLSCCCEAPGQVLYSSDLQIGESHGGGAGANV